MPPKPYKSKDVLNQKYKKELKNVYSATQVNDIINCIDTNTNDLDLFNSLKGIIGEDKAKEEMERMGFITLGG